jgi:hypothetical protein
MEAIAAAAFQNAQQLISALLQRSGHQQQGPLATAALWQHQQQQAVAVALGKPCLAVRHTAANQSQQRKQLRFHLTVGWQSTLQCLKQH